MILIIYYVALVIAGDCVAIIFCLWIEGTWPVISLPLFLALSCAILWLAWLIAVRMSEPKVKIARSGGATHPAE
jgi:uncharacterized membrane protein